VKREILKKWVLEALRSLNGQGHVKDVAKHIWSHHEGDLRDSDLIYTWQYDMRWAATKLRHERKIKQVAKRGAPWELA
jgi:hypothetical protein